jgi:formylglycine-generating enzyme required for sulfatase activity
MKQLSVQQFAMGGMLVAAVAVLVLYYALVPTTEDGRPGAVDPAPSDALLASRPGAVFRDCAACPALVVVPAGRFTMGAAAGDAEASEHERPQRDIAIAQPFALGRTEVTAAEYAACAADGACPNRGDHAPWGGGRMPVVKVEWRDAQAFATWLSGKTGKAYRLPSEAEWEYAARGGTTQRFVWGDQPGRNRANCEGCGSAWDGRQGAPVASFHANPMGLYDMLGNLWEWTEDCWAPSHADVPADGSARPAPARCTGRVLRGGSFDLPPSSMRVTSRTSADAEVGEIFIGFRIARSLAAPAAAR